MKKCDIGSIGHPRFNIGDEVGFYLTPYGEKEDKFFVGKVSIIDRFGTFEQCEEPSYDIMVEDWLGTGSGMLVKHHRESWCYVLD